MEPRQNRCADTRGFTLIELMIVVVVIGILAGVGVSNFINMRTRANEATVKANMHSVQVATEDYSVQNDGFYPTAATDQLPDGRTLAQNCPDGDFPKNPFTKLATVVQFNANPSVGSPGELAMNPANTTNYMLKGNGPKGDTLKLVLTTGQ